MVSRAGFAQEPRHYERAFTAITTSARTQAGRRRRSQSATDTQVLLRAQPDALSQPRQQARFLCGLTSPAQSRARIGRNSLFGALESLRFADVLAWCSEEAQHLGHMRIRTAGLLLSETLVDGLVGNPLDQGVIDGFRLFQR